MAEAKRDQNHVTTLMAVSSVDGVTPVLLYADPTTHRLLVDSNGGGGGGGTPGGSSGQLQYNNAGAFGGISTATFDGTSLSLNSTLLLTDNTDATKKVTFVLSGITTATTRTWTFPNTNGTFARIDAAQTFTGVQTMTSPSITTSIVTGSATFSAFNTTATTLNFGGAATTLNIGGTPAGSITHNYSVNPTGSGNTKTLNIGTGGVSGSTTNLNLGSVQGGVVTINSPTLALGTSSITMSGSIGVTGTRVTKLWATDIESTNIPTVGGVALPTADSATTFTNKRIQPRSSTAASGDITPDLSTANVWQRTAISAGITINAPTGTPVLGEVLVFMLLDNGTSRALTWNAAYTTRVMGDALPTATTIGKQLLVTAQYSGSTWLCLSVEEI